MLNRQITRKIQNKQMLTNPEMLDFCAKVKDLPDTWWDMISAKELAIFLRNTPYSLSNEIKLVSDKILPKVRTTQQCIEVLQHTLSSFTVFEKLIVHGLNIAKNTQDCINFSKEFTKYNKHWEKSIKFALHLAQNTKDCVNIMKTINDSTNDYWRQALNKALRLTNDPRERLGFLDNYEQYSYPWRCVVEFTLENTLDTRTCIFVYDIIRKTNSDINSKALERAILLIKTPVDCYQVSERLNENSSYWASLVEKLKELQLPPK